MSEAKAPRKQIYDLVGEGQRNSDGSYRQRVLQACLPGDPVDVAREADNPHDRNAVAIRLASGGQQIGYISRADAAVLAPFIDAGLQLKGRIHELTGGLETAENFGCRVCLVNTNKQFRDFLPLRPEQRFYEHAPTWRAEREAPPMGAPASRSPKKGVFSAVFRGLFK